MQMQDGKDYSPRERIPRNIRGSLFLDQEQYPGFYGREEALERIDANTGLCHPLHPVDKLPISFRAHEGPGLDGADAISSEDNFAAHTNPDNARPEQDA